MLLWVGGKGVLPADASDPAGAPAHRLENPAYEKAPGMSRFGGRPLRQRAAAPGPRRVLVVGVDADASCEKGFENEVRENLRRVCKAVFERHRN